MDDVVKKCLDRSLAGDITFLQVVMELATVGIERYIVDLVGYNKYSYGANGDVHHSSFDFKAPPPPKAFHSGDVQSAIRDIQQGKINYVTFLQRIIAAGCSHYEVFIDGKKAIYFGRDGSHHIELFPAPAK